MRGRGAGCPKSFRKTFNSTVIDAATGLRPTNPPTQRNARGGGRLPLPYPSPTGSRAVFRTDESTGDSADGTGDSERPYGSGRVIEWRPTTALVRKDFPSKGAPLRTVVRLKRRRQREYHLVDGRSVLEVKNSSDLNEKILAL